MANWIVDDSAWKTSLDALADDSVRRQIRRTMVENGAKVLVKEMKATIESRHHVVSGAMRDSVAPGKVYEDVDGTSIEVWPQEHDPRGVSNAMKAKIINYGFYNKASSVRWHKDPFLNEAFRKRCEPRIFAVMSYTFQLEMEKLNK